MREIPLTRGLVALVDDEDCDFLNQQKWCATQPRSARIGSYAVRTDTSTLKTIYMHRIILGCEPGEIADHIDGCGLNNQRSNLRKTCHQGNSANRSSGSSTGFKGVCLSKSYISKHPRTSQPYVAQITMMRKKKNLGNFASAEDAARAYDKAALAAFGEMAFLNFPEEK